ncbi:MAG: tetratricopeptide repeat protein, partial [Gammaproteobacteria bacterium]|nr:tetratricopeptide repeat protein [Gammaproteobacteria bacterium]NIR93367.1 tetratricopeptide repeat protein [Gammaproteobacteria bacterium]NIW47990.1 tetratricopeptide repeat protein [Gammaproteobacteria bacterium]NIX57624.1 tetratricopeptide repeat protein [candidate division Zixibacteria bacterium]
MATLKIGLSFLNIGDYGQARISFQSVIRSDWNDHIKYQARVGLARVYLTNLQYEEARDVLEPVLVNAAPDVAAEAQFLVGKSYQD